MAEFFLVFDQGYEDSIISARLLASMGRSLFVIVFCGWLILLVLYILLYQFKQNKTLGIMRSVGATPMGAGWYAFICGIILGVTYVKTPPKAAFPMVYASHAIYNGVLYLILALT